MSYHLLTYQASVSSPPPLVWQMEEDSRGQDRLSFFGYSNETSGYTTVDWHRGDTVASEHGAAAKLRSLFVICDASEVAAFLAHNPSLVDWLVRGWAMLGKHFGDKAKFVLKPAHSVDSEGNPRLVVYIRTQLPVTEAMKRLDAFDNEWLFDQIDLVGNKIIFNLAPV